MTALGERAARALVVPLENLAARWFGRMPTADARRWEKARTVADLGELTAQWLEGSVASQPGYWPNCGPAEETTDLVPVLAGLNRAGYLTDCSQPGWEGESCRQRAAISGYVEAPMLGRIRAAVAGTGLILVVHTTTTPRRERVTVTLSGGQPFTGFGHRLSRCDIAWQFEVCHPDAIAALCQAWQVSIVDPVWGRDDVLWPLLADLAHMDTVPAPPGYAEQTDSAVT